MQGQQDQYVSYCLTLNPSNLTRNEAYNVLRLNPDETLSEDQIKKAYRKQSLVYHPDKNSIEDNRKYTEVFQCITKAFELLMDSLNNDRETETHYQHSTSKQSPPRKTTNSSRQRTSQNADRKNRGSEYNHREPSWLYTVEKCLVDLAKEGLSELKEQSPRTFNENYLGQMGWRVPATALVMKGIERLVRQKNYELLRQKIECIGNAQRFKRIMDVHISKDFAGEFHSFIGETRVSSFNINDIAGLRINPYDREYDFYYQLHDVVNFRVELDKQSQQPCTHITF
jgi:hypothetical protein